MIKTYRRCNKCNERLYRTILNHRLYCKKCYKYVDYYGSLDIEVLEQE